MEMRLLWNDREITGNEPEYREHFRKLIIQDFLPYARAHPEQTARSIRYINSEETPENT
ncbi:hypothetical protein [Oscillibacter sp. GMB15532]|uniref:hypothetical protein n=1 Tax=Oscillibacter sp. GMB15532 TaxID=3230022 RepID=UPI0034E0238F